MRWWRRRRRDVELRGLVDELAACRLQVDVNGHRIHDVSLIEVALTARFAGPERTLVRGIDEPYRVRVVRAA